MLLRLPTPGFAFVFLFIQEHLDLLLFHVLQLLSVLLFHELLLIDVLIFHLLQMLPFFLLFIELFRFFHEFSKFLFGSFFLLLLFLLNARNSHLLALFSFLVLAFEEFVDFFLFILLFHYLSLDFIKNLFFSSKISFLQLNELFNKRF